MALPQSNYTQFPNEILDNLHLLSGSELKVISAICRHTLGFHQQKKRLSISLLMKLTGLSNKGVIAACASLCDRDWITKFSSKKGSEFSLKLECPDVVKKVHDQEEIPMNSVHNTCEKSSQPPMNLVHTYKEINKETSKVSFKTFDGATTLALAPNALSTENTPLDEKFDTLSKLTEFGVEVNKGLKSRILKLPTSVVKVAIGELQACIAKGNLHPEDYAKYLNAILSINLNLYKKQEGCQAPDQSSPHVKRMWIPEIGERVFHPVWGEFITQGRYNNKSAGELLVTFVPKEERTLKEENGETVTWIPLNECQPAPMR